MARNGHLCLPPYRQWLSPGVGFGTPRGDGSKVQCFNNSLNLPVKLIEYQTLCVKSVLTWMLTQQSPIAFNLLSYNSKVI